MVGSKSKAFRDLISPAPEVKPEVRRKEPKPTETVPIRTEVRERVSQSIRERMLNQLFGGAMETFAKKMESAPPADRARFEKSTLKRYLG